MDYKDKMRKMVRYFLDQDTTDKLPLLVEQPHNQKTPNQNQMDFWSWAEKEYGSAKGVIPLLVSLVDSNLISGRISTSKVDNHIWVDGVTVYGVTFEGYRFHIFG